MHIQTILLTISTFLVILSPLTYIISIFKGTSKPHRMTRFILAFVLTLNFLSIVAAQGNTGAKVFAGITFLQGLVIFLISLWKGMGGSNKLDYLCFIISIIGIIGWKITGSPLIGLWFSILADFAAYIPAFIKTWKHPYTESPWYYLLGGLAAILSLMTYNIDSSSIFQIYIALSCVAMIAFIYRKKFRVLF